MSEFTGVISSTGLEAGEEGNCPRELLGLFCMTSEYGCLCEQVASSDIATVRNEDGRAVAVELTMRLKAHDRHDTVVKRVIKEVNVFYNCVEYRRLAAGTALQAQCCMACLYEPSITIPGIWKKGAVHPATPHFPSRPMPFSARPRPQGLRSQGV